MKYMKKKKNPGSIIGNSVNKSDQALVHWLLWSRPVLIFNSCCHTHTHRHTHTRRHTHTHPGWRAAQPSLSLCCARRAGRRGAERTAFFGTSRQTEPRQDLVDNRQMISPTRDKAPARLLDMYSVAFPAWDRRNSLGESIVDDLSSALSLSDSESYERCSTKIHCVLSRTQTDRLQNFSQVKETAYFIPLPESFSLLFFFFRETEGGEKKHRSSEDLLFRQVIPCREFFSSFNIWTILFFSLPLQTGFIPQ